jgi:hypothetical protein
MDGEHREHITQARDLLELAAQTPEGRADLRGWLGQVMQALGREDGTQDAPDGQDGTAWNRRALARSGLTVALSAEGGEPQVLYLAGDESTDGGAHDNGGQAMPQYTEAELREAYLADEVARLSLVAMGGPQRPQYAGLSVPEPAQADELDDADLAGAALELSARTGGQASFGDIADAADELALSRDADEGTTLAVRASALGELARSIPGGDPSELEIEMAARREVGRLTGQDGPVLDGRVADIVARNRDLLSETPRGPGHHLDVIEDEDPTDHANPSRGGAIHPEVRRILEQHGVLVGYDGGSERIRPKSPALRAAERRRARPGHTGSR